MYLDLPLPHGLLTMSIRGNYLFQNDASLFFGGDINSVVRFWPLTLIRHEQSRLQMPSLRTPFPKWIGFSAISAFPLDTPHQGRHISCDFLPWTLSTTSPIRISITCKFCRLDSVRRSCRHVLPFVGFLCTFPLKKYALIFSFLSS